jgi:Na+-transporting NADH:ubiquinone oxidoreductase subunit NqrD
MTTTSASRISSLVLRGILAAALAIDFVDHAGAQTAVSATKDLACPFCGATITVARARLFPSRRDPIPCPSCGGLSLLPWAAVLIGMAVMLPLMVIGVLAIKPLFKRGTLETPMDFVLAGSAFLAVGFVCSWIASWVCSQAARELTPYRRAR